MNIDVLGRQKLNDILQSSPEQINQNFDRLTSDIITIADALNAYEIDLSSDDDVTGNLGVSHLNSGTNAAAGYFWEGTGAWVQPVSTYTPRSTTRRWSCFHATPGTIVTTGIAAPTETSAAGSTVDATSVWRTYTSGAGVGAQAGLDTVTFLRATHNPTIYMYVRTGTSLTGVRLWLGLSAAGHTNVDTHAGNTVSFRYSTVASDTGWMGVTRDGTTQAVTAKVADIAVSTAYLLKIAITGGGTSVAFSVDGGTAVTATANIPGAVNLLLSMQIFSTAGGARTWEARGFHMEGD